MKYFNSFQKVITTDYNNNAILLTNLMQRVEVIPSLLQNPLVFYSYDVQESDTPEIIADKYYGDPYRYWLVLFANQITDPQWQWPLTSQQFSLYLNDKYSAAAGNTSVLSYTQGTISQYNKTITTTDSITSNTTSVPVPNRVRKDFKSRRLPEFPSAKVISRKPKRQSKAKRARPREARAAVAVRASARRCCRRSPPRARAAECGTITFRHYTASDENTFFKSALL